MRITKLRTYSFHFRSHIHIFIIPLRFRVICIRWWRVLRSIRFSLSTSPALGKSNRLISCSSASWRAHFGHGVAILFNFNTLLQLISLDLKVIIIMLCIGTLTAWRIRSVFPLSLLRSVTFGFYFLFCFLVSILFLGIALAGQLHA